MAELLFVLYLFSGLIKQLFTYNPSFSFPVDLTGLTIIFIVVYLVFNWKSLRFKINKRTWHIIMSFLALWVWILFSSSYTSSGQPAISKSFLMITNFIPIIFLTVYQQFNIDLFLKIFSYAILIAAFIFLPIFFYLLNIGYNGEMRTFIGGYLSIGLYIGMACIVNLTSRKFKLVRDSRNIYLNFLFGGIMLSLGARGPLVILVLCYCLYLLSHFVSKPRYVLKRKHLYSILCAVAISIMSLIIIDIYTDGAVELLINRTIGRLMNLGEDTSSLEREDFIIRSLQVISSSVNNFLFGTGIGSFVQECYGYDDVGSPHNIILEVWLELGMVGVVLIGILFYSFLYGNKKKYYVSGFVIIYIICNLMKSHSLPELRIPFTFLFLYSSIYNTQKYSNNINCSGNGLRNNHNT